ncbi:GGDEF domain-containing protein [Actinoplanes flavus]|uniref:GGDEF domain-containing protein n=1 Tax=Actinoplanes flavus TaxID=2820290 RepID=A0ABS3UZ01_9ACTN|nr:GGDEF domain-containing protein [Actinoplanes flavus]MBO3743800.1 GGDEF domain-containing protein [Actinoplanes flavus]
MRTVTGVPSDQALLSRRRTIELSGLASRSIGLVCTALYAAGIGAMSPGQLASTGMRTASWVAVAVMLCGNLVAVGSLRRPGSRWYELRSTVQVALDVTVICGFVVVSEDLTRETTWPLMALAVVIAAIRQRLPGAVVVWALTSAVFVAAFPHSPDVPFVLGGHLMIAVITGTQSSSLVRHLRTLQETRAALQHQATHDGLTGLPNRAHLAGCADRLTGRPLGVLLLDLNGFKQVNDTHGHAAGDLLLHRIADRLTTAVRGLASPGGETPVVGRLGGDEFLVLLPGAGHDLVAAAGERIREAVRAPADLGDGVRVTVGVSIGVALRPAGGEATLDALTAEADAAMYREKHRRRQAA